MTSDSNTNHDLAFFAEQHSQACVVAVSASTLSAPPMQFLKVAVPAGATKVSLSYDPVSAEESRKTRQMNQAVRLGFMPPAASTR